VLEIELHREFQKDWSILGFRATPVGDAREGVDKAQRLRSYLCGVDEANGPWSNCDSWALPDRCLGVGRRDALSAKCEPYRRREEVT
jgi:hypothetical protein